MDYTASAILREWEQIRGTKWWELYQKELEKELWNPLIEFGNGNSENMGDSRCRWLQGIHEGIKRVKVIPKRLEKKLNIDKTAV